MNETLKEKLEMKIDQEYDELVEELKKSKPEIIIERAYELISKEEMTYKVKSLDYEDKDIKILLKRKNILNECYENWLEEDSQFNQLLDDCVSDTIEEIINEEQSKKHSMKRESR